MSWSIEERIGECRPFPAQVVVYRGETDECLAYVSGEVADRLKAENASLRERITTQKQTIQAYRDESREWREVAKRAQAENAKLRELVNGLRYCANEAYGMCARVPVGGKQPFTCCPLYDFDAREYRCEKLMRELGIEVDR